jgi:hypothetical protein
MAAPFDLQVALNVVVVFKMIDSKGLGTGRKREPGKLSALFVKDPRLQGFLSNPRRAADAKEHQ